MPVFTNISDNKTNILNSKVLQDVGVGGVKAVLGAGVEAASSGVDETRRLLRERGALGISAAVHAFRASGARARQPATRWRLWTGAGKASDMAKAKPFSDRVDLPARASAASIAAGDDAVKVSVGNACAP